MVWQYVIAPVYMCVWHQSDLHQRSIHCSQELQPPGEKSGQLTGQLQSGTCNNLLHVILLCICIANEKNQTIWGDTEHKISHTDLDKLVYFRLIHGVFNLAFLTHVVVFRRHELSQTLITENWVFSDIDFFLHAKDWPRWIIFMSVMKHFQNDSFQKNISIEFFQIGFIVRSYNG